MKHGLFTPREPCVHPRVFVGWMYIYSTVSFDNFKHGISIPHVTNATTIFEIVSDRLAPVEYKRSGCMLTPLLIGYD
jgi:hypothetical protein